VGRPISAMVQGGTLRIMDAEHFRVTWTMDGWATKSVQDAKVIGRPGAFLDIQTPHDFTGSIVFTMFWPDESRWLGRNYDVAVYEEPVPQTTAATKPPS